jgi:hypothetical protein
MKNMDEMMELLTEEINGVHTLIAKLEKRLEDLKDLGSKADTSIIQYYVRDHLRQADRTMEDHNITFRGIHAEIDRGKLIPRWIFALFCTAFIVTVVSLSYFGHHFIQFENRTEQAYIKGKEAGAYLIKGYFDDHPIIYKDFQKWAKKQDSVPKQK